VRYVDLRPQSDGTVDLCWGRHQQQSLRNNAPGLTLKLRTLTRGEHIGFLGLPAAEPAYGQIRAWLASHHEQVVASADASAQRRTVREPRSGLAIDLPVDWAWKTGWMKSRRVLGIPMESLPKWSDTADVAWNTLQVEPGLETIVLRLNLDPGRMPASLDAVLGDLWARLFRLKVAARHPAVQLGCLKGFGVTHDLQGAGPSASLGLLRVSAMTIKDGLQQTQLWLRGHGHALHVHHVTPTDAVSLRESITRVLATLRFEH